MILAFFEKLENTEAEMDPTVTLNLMHIIKGVFLN
jgi:hypothetical protein